MTGTATTMRRSTASPRRGIALAFTIASLGCASDGATGREPQQAVASIALSGKPAEDILIIGGTATLVAEPRAADGTPLTDRLVSWSTSDATRATVSQAGVVTALGAGPVVIKAAAEGVEASSTMSVRFGISVPPVTASDPLSSTAYEGAVRVTVPPGAATAGSLHVLRAPNTPGSRVRPNTTYDVGPSNTALAKPITIELRFDPVGMVEYEVESLRLYRVDGTSLTMIENGSVDVLGSTVSAQVNALGRFTVAVPNAAATIEFTVGDGQSAPIGTEVAVDPRVLVRDAGGAPVPFARVRWTAWGDSWLSGDNLVRADENGVATTGWWLAHMPGEVALDATVEHSGIPPATITALSVSPPGVNLLIGQTPEYVINGTSTFLTPRLDLTNRGSVELMSLSVELQWDPAQLELQDSFAPPEPWRDALGALVVRDIDESSLASGRLTISGSSAAPTVTSFHLAWLRFRAIGLTPLDATVTAVATGTNTAGETVPVFVRAVILRMRPQ